MPFAATISPGTPTTRQHPDGGEVRALREADPVTEPIIWLLFAAGYPTAIVLIARFRRIVRTRALRLFLLHEIAVAAIVTGWALLGRPLAAFLNAAWLLAAAGWWWWRR